MIQPEPKVETKDSLRFVCINVELHLRCIGHWKSAIIFAKRATLDDFAELLLHRCCFTSVPVTPKKSSSG